MEHYNELYHTGVMGMKWGKRKIRKIDKKIDRIKKQSEKDIDGFQPHTKTGISTKSGKQVMTPKDVTDIMDSLRKTSDKQTSKLETKKSKIQAKIQPKKTIKDISDDELKKTVQRLQMEKQYKTLTSGDVSKGKAKAKKLLTVATTVATVTTTGLTIHGNAGKIKAILEKSNK